MVAGKSRSDLFPQQQLLGSCALRASRRRATWRDSSVIGHAVSSTFFFPPQSNAAEAASTSLRSLCWFERAAVRLLAAAARWLDEAPCVFARSAAQLCFLPSLRLLCCAGGGGGIPASPAQSNRIRIRSRHQAPAGSLQPDPGFIQPDNCYQSSIK